MKSFIYSFTLFESILIFCVFSILGINFEGSDSSIMYGLLTATSFLFSLFYIVKDIRKNQLSPSIVVVIFIIIIWGVMAEKVNTTMYRCFVMFCIPSALIANTCAKSGDISWLCKWLDIFTLVISFSLLFSLPRLLSSIISGDSYYSQTLSYNASFAFSINLFLYKYGNLIEHRIKFFNSKWYSWILMLLFPLQIAAIFFSGGRGGAVVIFVSLILFALTYKGSIKKLLPAALSAGIVAIILLNLASTRLSSGLWNILEINTARVFSYISTEGVDMTETSGRDDVYALSCNLIKESPFLGYGLFEYVNYLKEYPYPHNIFLEWLLQGGAFFCIVSSIFLFKQLRKLKLICNHTPEMQLLLPLLTYQMVQLMFSGSYMQTGLFWFLIVFLYSYRRSQT